MEHIAPLIQTILWVSLIAGIVWRFNVPIHGLLTALQKRVESGSNIKAGPFEISQQVQPQGVEQQIRRTKDEIAELVEAQSVDTPEQPQLKPSEVKSRFLVAEDLALRAVQVEYQKSISRQVELGGDLAVDGVFTVDGQLNIVEVKHFIRGRRALPTARKTLESFQVFFQMYRWRNTKLILAVVLHSDSEVDEAQRQLSALAADFDFPIDVRCYGINELKSRFGLNDA